MDNQTVDTRTFPVPGLNGCTVLQLQSQTPENWEYSNPYLGFLAPAQHGWCISWNTWFNQIYRPGGFDDENSYLNKEYSSGTQEWVYLLTERYGADNLSYDPQAVERDNNRRQDLSGYGGVYLEAPAADDSCAIQEGNWNPVTKEVEGPPVDRLERNAQGVVIRRGAYNYTCNGKCKK